jgi:hypothetical protein
VPALLPVSGVAGLALDTAMDQALADPKLMANGGDRYVCGPADACVEAAQRIGWPVWAAAVLRDKHGKDFNL